MSALTPEQEAAAEAEIQNKEAERPRTQKERIDDIETAITQLAENQKTIVQSLASLNKPQPASPTSQNQLVPQLSQDKPAAPAIDLSQLAPMLQLLMGGEPKADPFHEAGKIMFESFADSIMKTSGRILAKEARVMKHEYY